MPTTAQHFVYELQQDWDRQETYQGVADIMKAHTAYGGEQESTEQVNCVVSSMHQTGPLYPQLLTYRYGAANRRFGPAPEVNTRRQSVASRVRIGLTGVTRIDFGGKS